MQVIQGLLPKSPGKATVSSAQPVGRISDDLAHWRPAVEEGLGPQFCMVTAAQLRRLQSRSEETRASAGTFCTGPGVVCSNLKFSHHRAFGFAASTVTFPKSNCCTGSRRDSRGSIRLMASGPS